MLCIYVIMYSLACCEYTLSCIYRYAVLYVIMYSLVCCVIRYHVFIGMLCIYVIIYSLVCCIYVKNSGFYNIPSYYNFSKLTIQFPINGLLAVISVD